MAQIYDGYVTKRIFFDFSENTTVSQPVNIAGYEVVGIGSPSADDGTPTIDSFEVDLGDGTFRQVVDSAGSAVVMTAAIDVDEVQMLPATQNLRIVGGRFRIQLDTAVTVDREYRALCVKL